MQKTSPTKFVDQKLAEATSLTMIQILAIVVSTMLFSLGSQIFYCIPFYLYYPAMTCFTQQTDSEIISFTCDRARACQPDIVRYEFDWTDERTLNNWMTSLDLICEPPFRIGLVGSINLLAVALGSVLLTSYADVLGRKPFLLIAAGVTPLGLGLALVSAKDLVGIYIMLGVVALFYNPRCSTSFLFANEMIPAKYRLLFNNIVFTSDGIISILTGYYYYKIGDQFLTFKITITLFVISLLCIYLVMPETPSFLLTKGRNEEYINSIQTVTGK